MNDFGVEICINMRSQSISMLSSKKNSITSTACDGMNSFPCRFVPAIKEEKAKVVLSCQLNRSNPTICGETMGLNSSIFITVTL